MKKSVKITFSAIMAALAVAFMLLSYFPYLTYAIPAISGMFIMVTVIEVNKKYAFAAYLASAVLVFLLAEPESKLMFVALFGYYPILKAILDRVEPRPIQWILKFAVFNAAVTLVYFVFASLFGITLDGLGDFGKYTVIILFVAGNFVFVFYDIAISKMAAVYLQVLAPKFKKIFKF